MISIIDFRCYGGSFWVAIFTPLYRHSDYAERPGHISTSTQLALTAEEVGQLLGGN